MASERETLAHRIWRLTLAQGRAWRTFWYGPVCRQCKTRHPNRLTDVALCIAHRATGLPGHGAKP